MDHSLAPMEVAPRIDRLRGRFEEAEIDALLVADLTNIRYLTGFTGSAALLLVRTDDLLFVTDGRYRDQSSEQLEEAGVEARIEVHTGPGQQEAMTAAASGIARMGLESDRVTWAQALAFTGKWFPDAEAVVPTRALIADLRRVKDIGEQSRVAAACRVADDAFEAVKGRLLEGPTEREFALELEFEMRRRGAEAVSFEPIVASGPNGAKPHARPGDRRIAPGELVVLDFGAKVHGYCSDMTRTVVVGEPSAEARRMYDVVMANLLAVAGAALARAEIDRHEGGQRHG